MDVRLKCKSDVGTLPERSTDLYGEILALADREG